MAPISADIAALDARLARGRPEGYARLTAPKPKPANAEHGEAGAEHENAAAHEGGAH